MGSHRDLKAWQHAKLLAVGGAQAARRFPPEEQRALAEQLRRAAYGAALNIAEGKGRAGARDYRRFLVTARNVRPDPLNRAWSATLKLFNPDNSETLQP